MSGRLPSRSATSPPPQLPPENHPPIHRPHRSSLTPHLLHRDRQTSQARLIMERINHDRDLIRQSSIQGPRRGLRTNINLSTG
ncbi:hypothetical protein HID58_005536 [Brassica napus]|uniref:Uncharacterized protein n=1 Tax=Brassica napus TaxID=3708 RepID=A0ABQ8E8W1_BRANA|nr:hypothetical protein HID58_005536 [Brassica napus]